MKDAFRLSRVTYVDQSISAFTNKWKHPGLMSALRKPYPTGNECYSAASSLLSMMQTIEMCEGNDHSLELGIQ